MMKMMLAAALTMAAFQESAPEDFWQECQIESSTLCSPTGCTSVEPTLKLYFGDYNGSDGRRRGYYYRCRRGADCDRIEDPWVGVNDNYRAFVARERGLISRIGPGGKVTDVATLDDDVLISRGSCWDAPPHESDLETGH